MAAPPAERGRALGLRSLGLIAVLGLSGCASDIDPRAATACRMAAVAIFDPMPLRIVDETATGSGEVSIALESRDDGAPHRIDCRFEPAGIGDPDLIDVRADARDVPGPRLFMLKRFWIGTAEAMAADPANADRGRGLPSMPFVLAYPLQSFLAALPNASVYSLLAATYSLIYGLSGRINLAFGEIAALGGFAALLGAAFTTGLAAAPILFVACILAVGAVAIHGSLVERWVMWPLRRSTGQQGLVATIGLALALQEYMRLAAANQPKYMRSILSGPIRLVRADDFIVTVTPLSLVVVVGAVGASLALLALLRFTGYGRAWRATSDDPIAAALCGVDPRRLSAQTFVLACALAGFAGAIVTVISGTVGFVYTTTLGLKALIAAIVGGIGSVPGAFLGGLAIAFIEAGWSAYFPIVYRDLVIDGLLVTMLVLRPGGLFGYRDLVPRRI